MDRMLYIAMTGAKQTMLAQAVNSNNLANATTTGFRADMESFLSMPLVGPGHDSRIYAVAEGQGVDFSQGSIQTTGRDLDVAVRGDGWFAVQANDGTEGYTRAGAFQVTPAGQLLTHDGLPVIGNGGPIALPPYQDMVIGGDGSVSIVPLGQQANTLAVVDRLKLVNPPINTLVKRADGLMGVVGGDVAPPDAAVQVASGVLEGSNVNTVDALTRMISLSREFEINIKMMKTAEDNDASAAQLLHIS